MTDTPDGADATDQNIDTETDTQDAAKASDGAKPDEALGEAGKKALEAERERRKALEAELKKLKDKDKTAEQLAAERLAEAERKEAELAAREARAEVAESTGLPVSILAGPKSNSVEDLTAFAEAVKGYVEASKKNGGAPIPTQGKEPSDKVAPSGDFIRDLLRRQ